MAETKINTSIQPDFSNQALKMLYEFEMFDNPVLINNMKMNVLVVSSKIKDVQFLIHKDNAQLLIFVKISWFAKMFKFNEIQSKVHEIFAQLLPSYRLRVIHDYSILQRSRKIVQEILGEGDGN